MSINPSFHSFRSKISAVALATFGATAVGCSGAEVQNVGGLGAEPEAAAEPEDAVETDPDRFVEADEDQLITFSIDVDTASYTNARLAINSGSLPQPESVRLEEFVNYFGYSDEGPTAEETAPFAIHTDTAPSPFGAERTHLMRVAIRGQQIAEEDRQPANLVFLVDTSGSMSSFGGLRLVKQSLRVLLDALAPNDTIALVTYAGSSGIALEPTPVGERGRILNAIDDMIAGGSTNGAGGIIDAYRLAEENFLEGGINRVILCTDGDFNVGLTGDPLIQLVEDRAADNVFLTVLGFNGSFDDAFLEDLSNRGDGNYAFIDSRSEAVRALSENVVSTLQVIAKDVKIQVEVDPAVVESYRLLGYHNRRLEDWEFNDDSVDAGELGSGHVVVALIEMKFQPSVFVPDQDGNQLQSTMLDEAFATVNVAYKKPTGDVSDYVERVVPFSEVSLDVASTSRDFQLSAAVAEFAEQLANSTRVNHSLADVTDALDAIVDDSTAVAELRGLVLRAAALQ